MLFLYRPRQTWMPYRPPRGYSEQDAYNLQLQRKFDATRRTAPPAPTREQTRSDRYADLKRLAELHASGAIDDAEFAAAKSELLDAPSRST